MQLENAITVHEKILYCSSIKIANLGGVCAFAETGVASSSHFATSSDDRVEKRVFHLFLRRLGTFLLWRLKRLLQLVIARVFHLQSVLKMFYLISKIGLCKLQMQCINAKRSQTLAAFDFRLWIFGFTISDLGLDWP